MSLLLLLALGAIAMVPVALIWLVIMFRGRGAAVQQGATTPQDVAVSHTTTSQQGTAEQPRAPEPHNSLDQHGTPNPSAASLPDAIREHAQRTRFGAWGTATLAVAILALTLPGLTRDVANAVGPEGPTGLALALTPLAVAITYAGAQLIGERTWPRPAGQVRAATLTARSSATTSPRLLRVVTLTWAGALTALLLACGLLGDGTRYSYSYVTGQDEVTSSTGPFPGWPYGLPTLALAAIAGALTVATLATIRRRPAIATLDAAEDLKRRRRSSTHVLVATQSALGLTLAGNLAFAGSALGRSNLSLAGDCMMCAAILVALMTGATALVALASDR